jgi:hypothetical protein
MSTDQVDDLMRSDGPTVLQTLPRKAVTSANAAGAPGLRMYLTHDESRHHRVSGPIAPIHERAASPASARTGRARGSRGYGLGHAVRLGSRWRCTTATCGLADLRVC